MATFYLTTFNETLVVDDVVSYGWYDKPPERGGGRPAVAVRLRRPSRLSAVSSSFVNLRRELTKPRGGRPTTRDPGQDLQSLPLLYATHMTLHAGHVVCHAKVACCAL